MAALLALDAQRRDDDARVQRERIAQLRRQRSNLRGELRALRVELARVRESRERWRQRALAAEWGLRR